MTDLVSEDREEYANEIVKSLNNFFPYETFGVFKKDVTFGKRKKSIYTYIVYTSSADNDGKIAEKANELKKEIHSICYW